MRPGQQRQQLTRMHADKLTGLLNRMLCAPSKDMFALEGPAKGLVPFTWGHSLV